MKIGYARISTKDQKLEMQAVASVIALSVKYVKVALIGIKMIIKN